MTRMTILVLCGLPGAGKSTLVRQLMEAAVRPSVQIHLFDYDQLHVDSLDSKCVRQFVLYIQY